MALSPDLRDGPPVTRPRDIEGREVALPAFVFLQSARKPPVLLVVCPRDELLDPVPTRAHSGHQTELVVRFSADLDERLHASACHVRGRTAGAPDELDELVLRHRCLGGDGGDLVHELATLRRLPVPSAQRLNPCIVGLELETYTRHRHHLPSCLPGRRWVSPSYTSGSSLFDDTKNLRAYDF